MRHRASRLPSRGGLRRVSRAPDRALSRATTGCSWHSPHLHAAGREVACVGGAFGVQAAQRSGDFVFVNGIDEKYHEAAATSAGDFGAVRAGPERTGVEG